MTPKRAVRPERAARSKPLLKAIVPSTSLHGSYAIAAAREQGPSSPAPQVLDTSLDGSCGSGPYRRAATAYP